MGISKRGRVNEGGQTKYREEYPSEVYRYLKTVGDGTMKLPKRCDLAILFKVDELTLKNWEEEYESFRTAMREVDGKQKSQLMDDGMYGGKEVNPQIAKFLLSANHGMAETTKNEVTGANGKDLIPSEIRIHIMKPEKDS